MDGSMQDKLTVEIDTDLLIKAVEKHPGLYKKSDPTYFHKSHHKSQIWHDVCRQVVPDYEQLKPQDRIHYVFSIQKRWKNLRTCFGRELALQKREAKQRKKNIPVKSRKRYSYFKKLSFLLDAGNDDTAENEDKNEEESDEESFDPLHNMKTEAFDLGHEVELEFEQENFASVFEPSPNNDKVYQPRGSSARHESPRSEGKVIEYLKDMKKDGEDEDKQFLMSLIPTFRKLSDKQKFEARIEILKVLKDISFQRDAGPSC